jgi:hypothetical protein
MDIEKPEGIRERVEKAKRLNESNLEKGVKNKIT